MKKKVILIAAALFAGFLYAGAQENKVVSASMHLKEYGNDQDSNALHDAKDAIDLAATNDKTKDEPKMYLYRGEVYLTYYEFVLSTAKKRALLKMGAAAANRDSLMKLGMFAYSVIDTTPICIAANSFMNVITIEPKGGYADDAHKFLPSCLSHIENKGRSDYSRQKFASALAMFEKAITIARFLGEKDTSGDVVDNVQNAAITADKMQNLAKAIQYYKMLTDMNVGGSQPYLALINDYNGMKDPKDSANAQDVLKKGRAAYPGDVNLLIAETNVYITSHNNDKAIENLQAAITKLTGDSKTDPSLLSNLYFVLGNTFDRIANPKNDSGRALPKPNNYEDLFSKAEENYTKAVNLTPNNFDELFDLGALYNNRATYDNRLANELPIDATDKFNKLQAEASDYFKKAQPWLEKAHAINHGDIATVNALLGIYASTGQTDKIKALKEGQ